MRNAFFEQLLEVFQADTRVVFLTGDLGFKLFDPLAAIDRDRVINVGIREQAMVGMAAGLALSGMVPVIYSIVPFLTLRCLEQVKLDLCYPDLPALLVGVGGGFAYGTSGPTHYGLEDVGVMSMLPNMSVLTPLDPDDVRNVVRGISGLAGPTYLRLGRSGEPRLASRAADGPIRRLADGSDGDILSVGPISAEALRASQTLRELHGLEVGVLGLRQMRPFPEVELMAALASRRAPVLVVEEHVASGGLGERLARSLLTGGAGMPYRAMSVPDRFPHHCASRAGMLAWSGLDADSLVTAFLELANGD